MGVVMEKAAECLAEITLKSFSGAGFWKLMYKGIIRMS